jgi:DNA-binding MarR family transcriptional regulator
MADLRAIFNDLVRLETELWNAVDSRLQHELELPLSHWEPLTVIDNLGTCRVLDIASALVITTGGASKLVDRLEANGYCRRLPNPRDRRSTLLELTASGRSVVRQGAAVLDDELQRRLAAVESPKTLQQFADTLGRLRAAGHRLADTEVPA